jgi:Fe-S-cluster containining protein
MEVDCEGCAGCCIDWRTLTAADAGERSATIPGSHARHDIDQERRGRYEPLDDVGNLAPVRRDEIRAFVDAGYGDVLQPRLFESGDGPSVTVNGVEVAAIQSRPAFLVGLRKPPKPVGPFGHDSTWLPTCAFLDPTTLQCRIHGEDLYPAACSNYPGENLALDVETECERVERVHGGSRLLDDDPPADVDPQFGPAAVGTTVFAHPDTDRLAGAVDRMLGEGMTDDDRAEFVAVAAASSPAMLTVSDPVYEDVRDQVLAADSWAGRAIDAWTDEAGALGAAAPDPSRATALEDDAGAPGTPGWGDADG